MKLVFFGTPDFAVASLEAIIAAGHEVLAVVTAPDRPAGRGHQLKPSPVKECALAHNLKVLQPTNLKSSDFVEELRSMKAEIQVVVAFRMLPEVVWNMPPQGTYNVHGSLLPDYRGAAPIHWAVVNGEAETGVTTFKLKHEIDTGSILLQRATPIGENETTGDVYERLMKMGAQLIVESLLLIESGKAELEEQPATESKHAPKINKEDAHVDPQKSASEVHNRVRGMNPFPGAFIRVHHGDEIETWKVSDSMVTDIISNNPGQITEDGNRILLHCQDYCVELGMIQPPGKKRLSAKEFINGFRGDLSSLSCQ